MAAGSVDILPQAVEFVLDNWTVLQLAVQHGFGGADSRDKVFWFKDVIVQVLTDNQTVECDELEDYISEILYNEFDTVVEDGSLEKISQKLCQFQSQWRTGKTENIQKEIQSISPVKLTQSDKAEEKEDDCDEDMDETLESSQQCTCEAATSSSTSCLHCNSIQEGIGNLSITSNLQEMSQNKAEVKNDEEEEGWEVVRRSKKR